MEHVASEAQNLRANMPPLFSVLLGLFMSIASIVQALYNAMATAYLFQR